MTDMRGSTGLDWELVYANPGDNLGLEVYPANIYYPGNQVQADWNIGSGRIQGSGLMVLAGPFTVPIFSLSATVSNGAQQSHVGLGGLDGGGKQWLWYTAGLTAANAEPPIPYSEPSIRIELICTGNYQEYRINGVPILGGRGLTGNGGATDYVVVAGTGWVKDIELRAPSVRGWPV